MEVFLGELCSVHVNVRFFHFVDLVVEFPRYVSCQVFLVGPPIFTQIAEVGVIGVPFVPDTLCNVTTGVRILESEPQVVG